MMKEPLTASVSIQELRYMRDTEHLSNAEIARRLDVTPLTVSRYLGPVDPGQRFKKKSKQPVTQQMIDDIQRLYKEGRSINSIAERYRISWNTVKKCVTGCKKPDKLQETPPEQLPEKEPEETPVVADEAVVEETVDEEPVEQVAQIVEPEVERKDDSMFEVISRRQTVRLKGSEYVYDVETDGDIGVLTILNGKTETMILDAKALGGFIEELERIRQEYLKGVA